MITMTPRAHEVVRQVTSHPRVGRRSGLRIATQRQQAETLGVRTVSGPRPGDRVVERDGARIYLDEADMSSTPSWRTPVGCSSW